MLKFIFILFFSFSVSAQDFKVLSWNVSNLGKSKTEHHINLIVKIIEEADIACLQEVVTSNYGDAKVLEILNLLNKKDDVWSYSLSSNTLSSDNRSERYVYYWRKFKFKINRKFELDVVYKDLIEREPYIGSFTINGFEFKIFNFHALPKKHNPESEIKYFKNYSRIYGDRLFFIGDFNCNERNSVFNPLFKLGFLNVFKDQKTTLKQKCKDGNCLANGYDNIFFNSAYFELLNYKPILFFSEFTDLKEAKKVSDHIPIIASFKIKKAEI